MRIVRKTDIKSIEMCINTFYYIDTAPVEELLILVDNIEIIKLNLNNRISDIALFAINYHTIIKDGKWKEDLQYLKDIVITSDKFTDLTFVDIDG